MILLTWINATSGEADLLFALASRLRQLGSRTSIMDWQWWGAELRTAGAALFPVALAALGLLVALALLGRAFRFLVRPFLWAARSAIRFEGAAGSVTTRWPAGLGIARLAVALMVAAAFQPKPFIALLSLFLSLVSFLAYSLPIAVIRMATALPQACTGDFGQKCAAPILDAGMEI